MLVRIEHRELDPATVVIAVSAKLMLGRECDVLETLLPELAGKGYRSFIFDMSGTGQIDSVGIGRFIQAYHNLSASGGKLVIAGASSQVRDSFRITRLDTVFQFYPDTESARAALGTHGPG